MPPAGLADLAPPPEQELLAHYREAEAASGVGWNYLAAVNLIETRLGSVTGTSSAGAQGPMQFLPSTFAAYGDGGDIHAPRDAILAAGRYLAANNFAGDPDNALFRYNHSDKLRAGREGLCGRAGRRSVGVHRVLPVGGVLPDDRRGCAAADRVPGHRTDPGGRLSGGAPPVTGVARVTSAAN
jgi:hypothetical protein